jgi:hypothetical protein
LLDLAPDDVEDFMWMFEVELESGLRLHAYKHIETRKYLHLDKEGRAFVYRWFGGVFEPLRDVEYFRRLRVDEVGDTIAWPNEADIGPETLYDHVQRRVREATRA